MRSTYPNPNLAHVNSYELHTCDCVYFVVSMVSVYYQLLYEFIFLRVECVHECGVHP